MLLQSQPPALSTAAPEITVAYANTYRTHCNVNFTNSCHLSTNFLVTVMWWRILGTIDLGCLFFQVKIPLHIVYYVFPFLCFWIWTGRKPEYTGPASRILCMNYAHMHFNMLVKTRKHIFDGEGIQCVKSDKASVTPSSSSLLALTSLPDSGI